MLDLEFSTLADALPEGALSETADDVTISLKTLMGETAVQLEDTKVSEFISKLLTGAATAQATFNEGPGPNLNSFPNPTPGVPQRDDQGKWYAQFTHNVAVRVPLDVDEITGSRAL